MIFFPFLKFALLYGNREYCALGRYKVFQRHIRSGAKQVNFYDGGNGRDTSILLGGTFLMADGHAEWSGIYAGYPASANVVDKWPNGWFLDPNNSDPKFRPPKDIWVHP